MKVALNLSSIQNRSNYFHMQDIGWRRLCAQLIINNMHKQNVFTKHTCTLPIGNYQRKNEIIQTISE